MACCKRNYHSLGENVEVDAFHCIKLQKKIIIFYVKAYLQVYSFILETYLLIKNHVLKTQSYDFKTHWCTPFALLFTND